MENIRVALVTTNSQHASYRRRVREMEREGFTVIPVILDMDKSRKAYVKRLIPALKLFIKLLKSDSFDICWAWGLDAALVSTLAKFFFKKPLIWDISDLLPAQIEASSLRDHIICKIEAYLYNYCDGLAVTSKNFFRDHYRNLDSVKYYRVIENLLEPGTFSHRTIADDAAKSIRVVYAGIFRSDALLNLIGEVAAMMPHTVEFHLYGMPSREVSKSAMLSLAENPNVHIHGPYNDPGDIQLIYDNADVVFGLLDIKHSINERILMPNRFYHAGVFRLPLITTRETEVAARMEEMQMGISIDNSPRALREALEKLTDYNARKDIADKMPPTSAFYYENEYLQFAHDVLKMTDSI